MIYMYVTSDERSEVQIAFCMPCFQLSCRARVAVPWAARGGRSSAPRGIAEEAREEWVAMLWGG